MIETIFIRDRIRLIGVRRLFFFLLLCVASLESAAQLGCLDPQAINYDAQATISDGSCEYPIEGCMDAEAINYNSDATVDNGSCEYPVEGCMDSEALNYNLDATIDDGTCEYPEPAPSSDP